MKFRKIICIALLLGLCTSCTTGNESVTETESTETLPQESTETTAESNPPSGEITFPEDFVYPVTDGSTSTTNLDKAVQIALYGGEPLVKHTKTYEAFWNLLQGSCDLIFTTPLSAEQLQMMQDQGFRHEAEPIAGEGFVFVVNKDNPVDTLTIEQLKGIYSGEITNWKEVGGRDAEIMAYQRNTDSGSQNYMLAFMGDTPLMKPVTDQVPASMSGILNVIANYDNGIDAIGYSVYAYSDGMYENISQIKYIKVNGVEPSHQTLADGTYPLLGYNYAVFSADEPEDSHVRTLVKWIQSDAGQQVIADAGYIPYRMVEGLTIGEQTAGVLYTAEASSGIPKPDVKTDYYFEAGVPDSFTAEGLDGKIEAFVTEATNELSQIDEEKMLSYVDFRVTHDRAPELVTRKSLVVNGYLSVLVGWRYNFEIGDSPDYYYDVRTAVFDIYTGEQLELSDLFFEGVDFVPLLNNCLAGEAVKSYDDWGNRHEMLCEFSGLHEGEFAFTADSIIFKPNTCFADGVQLSIADLSEYMITSIPRDMVGCISGEESIHLKMYTTADGDIGYGEEKNGIPIWYLDAGKAQVSAEVCDKVNAFIDNIYENHFTEEKLMALAKEKGMAAERVTASWVPDFRIFITGDRYILSRGTNTVDVYNEGTSDQLTVIDGQYSSDHFAYYFNIHTGELLKMSDLFTDGWEEKAVIYRDNEYFVTWALADADLYTADVAMDTCRITNIARYSDIPYYTADSRDDLWRAIVFAVTQSGDRIAVAVPQEYIAH
ncbi:MAG: hypothetical protein E7658_08280 [Ruminococcaceae bacterium]|nr:hypothetical protein [Oscillospiraceae bacterium]